MNSNRDACQYKPANGKRIMLVLSNAMNGREEEFNRWYDNTHVHEVIDFCDEVVSCQRYRICNAQLQTEQPHRYLAVYEFEGEPEVFLENLKKANERFDMSDTLIDPKVIVLEPVGEKVTAL